MNLFEQAQEYFLQLQEQLCAKLEDIEQLTAQDTQTKQTRASGQPSQTLAGKEGQVAAGQGAQVAAGQNEKTEAEQLQKKKGSEQRAAAGFALDEWQSSLGQGRSNILQEGRVLEKAGVNFSSIASSSLPPAASSRNPHLAGKPYRACGISIVVHPRNPYVPTSHANLRIFALDEQTGNADGEQGKDKGNQSRKRYNGVQGRETRNEARKEQNENVTSTKVNPNAKNAQNKDWWFGGGFDLTPYYIQEEDCVFWHKAAKSLCDKFDKGLYEELKKNCDDYFYLPHRHETRGIGGLFFDDFNRWDEGTCLDFIKRVGECYMNTYIELIKCKMYIEYGKRQRDFQLYRRGRYVEFNLLYDRGTLFGLQSGGRTESILMSLPPLARWDYKPSFEAQTEEGALAQFLQKKDWLKD